MSCPDVLMFFVNDNSIKGVYKPFYSVMVTQKLQIRIICSFPFMFLDVDECDTLPCENGGTCVDDIDGYTCQCTEEWIGDNYRYPFNKCHLGFLPCNSYILKHVSFYCILFEDSSHSDDKLLEYVMLSNNCDNW